MAFAGVLALAFLPSRAGAPTRVQSVAPVVPPTAAAPAVNAPPAKAAQAKPPAVPVIAAAAPSSTALTPPPVAAPSATPPVAGTATPAVAPPPPPDVWTPDEVAAGLRQCVQLLAPASLDVAMEVPMKHGQCGTPAPLALRSVGGTSKVEFDPAPSMNCRLAASLGEWVDKVLQPAAQAMLGSRITRIVGASSYTCRNVYNNPKLSLSEHATGNAIDIAAFVTADGRTITVSKAWGPTERDIIAAKKKTAEKKALAEKKPDKPKAGETAAVVQTPSIEEAGKKAEAKQKGRVQKTDFQRNGEKPAVVASVDLMPATTKEAMFLKRLHGGSCTVFATVLGPEANEAHRDHFHLDMKVRRTSRGVCH
ncbi:MAG TPA: extensin family protein [Hyphomicrobium sp.]